LARGDLGAYEPQGAVESVGDALGVMSGRLQNSVEDFKKYIESRAREGGAWRGTVRDGEKVSSTKRSRKKSSKTDG
jgi:hypothetical protein